MIKIYGMPTCPYCDYIQEQIKGRENEFEYINIGENIRNTLIFHLLGFCTGLFLGYIFKIRIEKDGINTE